MQGPLEDALIQAMREMPFTVQVLQGADILRARYDEKDSLYREVIDTHHTELARSVRLAHLNNQAAARRLRGDDLADYELPRGAECMRAWTDHGRPVMKYFSLTPARKRVRSSECLFLPPVDDRTPRSEIRLHVTASDKPLLQYHGLSYNADSQEHLDIVLANRDEERPREQFTRSFEQLGGKLKQQIPPLRDITDQSLSRYASAIASYVMRRNQELGSFSIS